MIHWALFSTLASGILYGCYCLLLRHDRWLVASRGTLVFSLLFSLLMPLISLPGIEFAGIQSLTEIQTLELAPTVAMPTTEATDTAEANVSAYLPMVLYIVGVAMTLALLTVSVVRTILQLRRLPVRRLGHLRLHLLDDDSESCSFFNHILIGTRGMSRGETLCILAHEGAHARMGHTLDVLAMRLMCSIAWFNPFAWLMLKELRAVHEYQADEAVLGSCGRMDYMRLLYQQATGSGYGHITNNFHCINIKKRIVMMNKRKTRFGAWKMLALLPVATLLTLVGCNNAKAATANVNPGRTLLSVNYNRTGGKALPFGGIGYNKVSGQWNHEYPQSVQVTCNGEGVNRSYNTWEISDFQTTKGLANGKVLNKNEKRLIKAIDRSLRNGKSWGTIVRHARVKATDGKVDLAFVATWSNGNQQGDADILISVIEEGAPEPEKPEFEVPESQPEFVGGLEALYKYLVENIRYPEQAKKDSIEGRVFVRFVIETDGRVVNAEVLRGIGGGCDEEALRVVNAMPKWKPGTVDGKPVRTHYNLPITFKLQ